MRKYEDCMYCMNSRSVVSENGIHYPCTLNYKKAILCIFGDKDFYVRFPLFKEKKDDEST